MIPSSLKNWLGGRQAARRTTPRRTTPRTSLGVVCLEDRTCPAVAFDFDYTYADAAFFTADKKAAIAQAGADMGRYLTTPLSAITPGGANTWSSQIAPPSGGSSLITISNVPIAANTIKVYVGSQNLGAGIFASATRGLDTTSTGSLDPKYRGNGGAFAAAGYDFAWGGSISINNTTTSFYTGSGAPAANQHDFRTVIRHELGHLLGIASAVSFSGDITRFANGGTAPPLQSAGGGHWADGTTWDGAQALMAPFIGTGVTLTATGLDYAALAQVGWATAVVFGTPLADTISLTSVSGNVYRATVSNSVGTLQVNLDSSGGVLVLAGAGDDDLAFDRTTLENRIGVNGGGGIDVLTALGTTATENFDLSPVPITGGLGFVNVRPPNTTEQHKVFFDATVELALCQTQGGNDTVFVTPSQTTSFAALATGGGSVTLATYGTSATESVGLTGAGFNSLGNVSIGGGFRPVLFNSGVTFVNYATGGGNDAISVGANFYTTFRVLVDVPGQVQVAASGTGLRNVVNLVPAPVGGLGSYTFTDPDFVGPLPAGAAPRPVYFDSGVTAVSYATAGGDDTVFVNPGRTTVFGVFGTGGGSVTLATYGTSATESVSLVGAGFNSLGNVSIGGGYQSVLFDKGVTFVNYATGGGNDTVAVGANFYTTFRVLVDVPGQVQVAASGTGLRNVVNLVPAAAGGFGSYTFTDPDFVGPLPAGAAPRPVYFDSGVTFVNYATAGGDDTVFVTPGTTTIFTVQNTGTGFTILATYGVGQPTQTAGLNPAPTNGLGAVTLTDNTTGVNYRPVYFDSRVQQVNFDPSGGTATVFVGPSTTTSFYVLNQQNASVVLATYGAGQFVQTTNLIPAPTNGVGAVTLVNNTTGVTYKSVTFDSRVQQVNFDPQGGTSTVKLTAPSVTNRFVVLNQQNASLQLAVATNGVNFTTTGGATGQVNFAAPYKPVQYSNLTRIANAGQKVYTAGNSGRVEVFDGATNSLLYSYQPFAGWTGEVRVAVGDVTGDGTPDIAAAAGSGGGPRVQVTSGSNVAIPYDNFVFAQNFTGGVFVALGDTTADGRAELVVSQGTGGSTVNVYNGNGFGLLTSLNPHPGFTGGVTVAAGDTNGDGRADVITGAGAGGGPIVSVFSGNGFGSLGSYFAFDPNDRRGIYVAAGDVNGDGRADIVAGAGAGAAGLVNVRSGNGFADLGTFTAYDNFTGGVRVAVRDVNGDGRADIITGAGPGGGPNLRVFSGNGYGLMTNFFAFDPNDRNGIYVG